jgi:hypothetical protein
LQRAEDAAVHEFGELRRHLVEVVRLIERAVADAGEDRLLA